MHTNMTSASVAAPAPRPTLEISIPEDAWRDEEFRGNSQEDPAEGSRLFARVTINGIGFHAEAIEVAEGEHGMMEAVDAQFEESLSAYYEAAGAGSPFQTMTIRGREYAVFITPHCN